MLVFNEGVPRSGKSYDAVKSHILVALAQGRKVYARLNGLDHVAIAVYLKLDESRVRELLIHVAKAEVVDLFQAVMSEQLGDWVIPPHLQNALFVIDEVHDFYVTGRQNLPAPVENFFALHGQNGMDGVIMTQAYKRLHPVIRARIERKNQFQKLTAVGLKGWCRQTMFVTIAPDKYEKVGAKTWRYDKRIFPLYAGYAPGATNVEVYEGGSRSAWMKLALPGALIAIAAFIFLPKLYAFFHPVVPSGSKTMGVHVQAVHREPDAKVGQGAQASPVGAEKAAPVKSAALPGRDHGKYDTDGMPPEVAYVFDLSVQARPRVAAVLESSWRGTVGVIEWREDQGHVFERMSFDDLRSMGVTVDVKPYGVRIAYQKQVIVATQWPVDMPGTIAQYDRAPGPAVASPVPSVSEPPGTRPSGPQHGKWAQRPMQSAYLPPEQTVVSAIGG
ncbi:zonular occludens toxin domain-containing protein [Xanthomonas sp. NCPPB 2632]|uniref:zonular occludens toxin domain-containing protein n=1 Tax=Xanthomonas sp. NCPPB 2632 TaxID=3240912 RepID=UPI003515205C